MLWVLAILTPLLMLWALMYTHRVFWARGGYMSQQIYAGLLGGVAFVLAAGTVVAAMIKQQWAVIPVALLPLPMALVSDLITRRKRRNDSQ